MTNVFKQNVIQSFPASCQQDTSWRVHGIAQAFSSASKYSMCNRTDLGGLKCVLAEEAEAVATLHHEQQIRVGPLQRQHLPQSINNQRLATAHVSRMMILPHGMTYALNKHLFHLKLYWL